MPVDVQPQGTISGTVRNASNGNLPLPDAVVSLLGTSRTYVSGPDGNYSGSAPGGIYDVACAHAGFQPDTAYGVNIVPAQMTILNFFLADNAGPAITGVTQLVSTPDTQGPYDVEATVTDPSGVASATLYYRVSGGGWIAAGMAPNGNIYRGAIPGMPAGTEIDYYVSALDVPGHESVDPPGAPGQFYTFRITQMLYTSDCEDPGDPNWQLGVAGDNATSGIWIREDPIGTNYNGQDIQPENDHTAAPGVKCFVTGNGSVGGAAGEADVDGGCTTLQSPVFDLSSAESAILRYWRWYGEGGNSTDDDFVVQVSSDGGSNWVELERVPDAAAAWTEKAIDLTTLITLSSQVVFRFLACDLNTGGLVEAAIDDFSIETFTPSSEGVADGEVAAVFRLERSHPNPFSRAAAIGFSLEKPGAARLTLYDVQGRAVRRLVNGPLAAGPHVVAWDGRDDQGSTLPSGVYFYRLDSGDRSEVRKLMRLQ
jgi:hypothetical protein